MLRNASVRLAGVAIVLLFALAGPLAGPKVSPASQVLAASPLQTAFTYQGHLTEAGEPANGLYDLSFALYDEAQAGNQIGPTLEMGNVAVAEGLFAVELNFGPVYDGNALWLEIGVRPGGDTAPYDTLLPRQHLTAAPYAIYAMGTPWSGLMDLPAGFADHVDDDTLADLVCASGQVARWNGAAWVCGEATGATGWSLTGNAGTTPGTHYLGTTDNQPLELRVNQALALRLEPDATSPNLIAGYGGNSVAIGISGGSIGGGGRDLALNQVMASFARVGGGAGNLASGYASVLGGGENNEAGGSYGVSAGGASNSVSGTYAVVGGGQANVVTATHAFIGGGGSNQVTGAYGLVAGGSQNRVTAEHASIGGGSYNLAEAAYGTIAGGGPSDLGNPTTTSNRVVDAYGTVAGGGGNLAGTDDADPEAQPYAAVGGGLGNVAGGAYATVAGGSANAATGYGATVSGGVGNAAPASYAWVGAGSGNEANNNYAAVGGGSSNQASATYATIGGGGSNTVTGSYGTIPGGLQNQVTASFGLAAGYGAHADHQGSFVWSSSGTGFGTTAPNQFLIDASGGVGIGTSSPTHLLTVAGDASIQSSRVISVGLISELPHITQAPRALYAVGDLLYATSYATNTLSIWNVADPQNHTLIGYTTKALQGPLDLQVTGNRAYLVSQNGNMLTILDVSDPANFWHVGETTEFLDTPQGVHVSGKYAYVASMGIDGRYDGLTILDVTRTPEIAATSFVTTYLQGTSDVFVSGNYAYVTSRDNDRLVVFDVSDPRHPAAVGYTEAALSAPVDVHVSGVYAYVVAEGTNTLDVFDIANPAQIVPVAQISTSLTHPRALYVSGDRAYLAYAGDDATSEQCGLAVLDISDPTNVAVLNLIDMSDWLNAGLSGGDPVPPKPVAVTGSGTRVYVANERHDSVTVFETDGLEASAVRAGELQVARLEVDDYAAIEGDLGVLGGLNVGPGGALIQGALTVEGEADSYIGGRLGIGPPATVITRSIGPGEYEEIVMRHPTHQLDVDGEARFRVNDHNHLILRSPNLSGDEDAYIDFADFAYPDMITPTARIEFDAADSMTHTTRIRFWTQGPDDPGMVPRFQVEPWGHVIPSYPAVSTLGEAGLPWLRVYSSEGFFVTSDARYKEDVRALPYGLAEVTALRPVAFTWKDRQDDGLQYGLIAQEVREVLPELVSGDAGPGGMLSLNYGELVPVLVKAVQEQQQQLDSQAEQISAMEARLAALEANAARPKEPAWQSMLQHLWLGGLALGTAVLAGRQWLGWRP